VPRRRDDGKASAPRRSARGVVVAAVVALLATGCQASSEIGRVDEDVLRVFGPWRGEAAQPLRTLLAAYEEQSGTPVTYTGTGGFAGSLVDRIADGDFPDVAVFPQPGLMNELAAAGFVRPLPDDVAQAALASYSPGIAAAVAAGTEANGVLFRLNVKSLVWYDKALFDERGYEVPVTLRELDDLSATMVEDGFTPWCFGVDAFQASGWPATDWVEELVLRQAGPELYDSWVEGETPFTDPAVDRALETLGELVLQSQRVVGGRRGVLNTSVERAQDPMFADPPQCLMYRQASFQVENLPAGIAVGQDEALDVFVLPPARGDDAPLVIGGAFMAAMSDRPEVADLLRFVATSPEALEATRGSGTLSPRRDATPVVDLDGIEARAAELLATATTVRFDASDLMYPPVGTRSFYDAMVFYIATLRAREALRQAQSGYDLVFDGVSTATDDG
jgi:alpha-glucoside transport system substrate-binding protein